MQCNNCGFPISEDASVCSNCGQEVKRDKDRPQNILFGRSQAKMLASLNMVELVLSDTEYTPQPGLLSRFTVIIFILIGMTILLVPLLARSAPNKAASTSSSNQFTNNGPSPTVGITAISPSSGPDGGGTTVIITGTGFTDATGVSFGQTPASSFTVDINTQIIAISPAGSGTVDVTITTPGGISSTSSADQFTYNAPPPPSTVGITAISPSSGSSTGGTTVVITGTGFTGATGVSFGQTPASSFTINSDTQITAVSPAGTGTVDVIVTTSGGPSATSSADQFTYNAPPSPTVDVMAISPSSGSSTGGTTVVITGTGFTGATGVSFGQTPASSFTVDSDTQITAVSPAGTGTVDVIVAAPGGTSSPSSADQFTYNVPPPTVTGISPNSGLNDGGTTVVITGTGFTGATSVSFGPLVVTQGNFTIDSDTQITVTSPTTFHSGVSNSTVDVTVTTPAGTSATSSADQFVYQ